MGLREYERFYIAHDALMVLTFVPCFIISLCSLCMVHRRNDPARSAFKWLKAAFAMFTLFVFLDFCGYGLAFAATRLTLDENTYYSDTESIILHLEYASSETFAVSRVIEAFTDIFILLMLVSLGTGTLLAQTGSPNSSSKLLELTSSGISAVLTILTIAYFGLRTHFNSVYYGNSYAGLTSKLADQLKISRQLDFSFRVLIFVLSLGVVSQSIMVKIQTQNEPRVFYSSNVFIASATLWLLRTVYGMAAMAATVNLANIFDDPTYHNYFYILDVIFSTWPGFVLLCLIFGLGRKKGSGLWSTEQSFMTQGGSAVSPWGFNYDPNSIAPPVVAHQAQVPPVQQQTWLQYQQPQPYYTQPGQNGVPIHQQTMPQYAPAPQQAPIQAYNPQNPISQARSPPPHEDAVGLNHQADGAPPQTASQPYYEKA